MGDIERNIDGDMEFGADVFNIVLAKLSFIKGNNYSNRVFQVNLASY